MLLTGQREAEIGHLEDLDQRTINLPDSRIQKGTAHTVQLSDLAMQIIQSLPLCNWRVKDVRFICATNGGRILGLDDLDANGIAIPIGERPATTISHLVWRSAQIAIKGVPTIAPKVQ